MIDFIAGDEHEVTAILAYRLWEKRGRPLGSPVVDWFEAEKQLALSRKSQTALNIFGLAMEANERP
jgi:hypothetical protein